MSESNHNYLLELLNENDEISNKVFTTEELITKLLHLQMYVGI